MKWSFEKCNEVAKLCKTRTEFKKKYSVLYEICRKNKWLDMVCTHIKRNIIWTKEKCQEEVLKYNTITEFSKKSGSAYNSSLKNGWLNDICSHMVITGNRFKRCIYVYEFFDNHIYVGLTYNINKRNSNHMKRGTVFNHIIKTDLIPKLIQLTDYIDVEEAKIKEGKYVEQYKSNGWNILNKSKTGAVGGHILLWTKEKCLKESLKYNTRSDFKKQSGSAYNSSKNNGWLNEICCHMVECKNPNGYWTKERCLEESLKYKTKEDFRKYSKAYSIVYKYGWVDEICSHMDEIRNPEGYWTKEKCIEESLKYKTKRDFKKFSSYAYRKSLMYGLTFSHLEKTNSNFYWTKEKCLEESLKYTTRTIFNKEAKGAYLSAYRNGWLHEICSHMTNYKGSKNFDNFRL